MEKYLRQFGTLKDFVDYSEKDLPTDLSDSMKASCRGDASFQGVKTKSEAFRILRNGYPDGRDRMKKVLEALNASIRLPAMYDEFFSSVEGCAPNVEAYIQGIPEDMFVISQIEADCPPSTLNLQFEMTFNCYVRKETAEIAGAVVFAAMEALKMQGCAVTAFLTHTSQSGNHMWQSSIPLPNNLDLDTLAFIFGHPAMLRVLTFSVMEHEQEKIRNIMTFHNRGGYGQAALLKNPQADIQLNMAQICDNCYTIEQAQKAFQKLVETKFKSCA